MKEWVPLNADGTAWRYGDCRIDRDTSTAPRWQVWQVHPPVRAFFLRWTDPYMAGAARVAEALEGREVVEIEVSV